ncbi:MAG: MBL fold metallo-hydrolase [Phycisphaerae bacterium]|jgi:phosphoribosyl 1,2-cyclic phosphate phosphodiesterase|nr:MBL fold metallo-hydrolase [Phycisphaerae bacterium]MCZ2399803.1 MBL fold metallo-hydrolase [Phycisphaerae bacterium]
MSVTLTILGSGTSHGVPMIGCDCGVCRSDDPRDRRTRTSAVFSFDGRSVLVDTGPELRVQCLACGVARVDAVLYTHHHADHVVGLDDIRRFNWLQRGAIPVYANEKTLRHIRQAFAYAFIDDPDYPSAKPQLECHVIDGPFELFGREVIPVPYMHGNLPVLGYRIGRAAYCPDCNLMPADSRALLRDLEVLVLDALRRRPHPTHFNLEQAVEEARRINARRTYFTHIAHELKHAETEAELPERMFLAYDGLVCTAD